MTKPYLKWIEMILSIVLIAFAALTLHDMQTAEGTGFYLAIRAGAENRRIYYDLLVDGLGLLCLLAALVLPCLLLKRFRSDGFLRLTAAYLAFLPVVSTAGLVHLMDGTEPILLREAILEGRPAEAVREGLAMTAPALAAGIPLLILLSAVLRTVISPDRPENSAPPDQNPVSKRKMRGWSRSRLTAAMLTVQALLLLAAILFPALTAVCSRLVGYLFLIYGFALWEKLYDACPGLRAWGQILFAGFWLRAIQRMLELMSIYHI